MPKLSKTMQIKDLTITYKQNEQASMYSPAYTLQIKYKNYPGIELYIDTVLAKSLSQFIETENTGETLFLLRAQAQNLPPYYGAWLDEVNEELAEDLSSDEEDIAASSSLC
jgi:hypothetical protein